MVGEENQHDADLKIDLENKKFNKSDEANVGYNATKRKRSRFDNLSNPIVYKKLKTEDQSYFEAKDLSEETSPGDPAPDEDKFDVKTFPTFRSIMINNPKVKKPNPTKKTTKTSKDLRGQQKISKFFSNTKAETKQVLDTSPANTTPT